MIRKKKQKKNFLEEFGEKNAKSSMQHESAMRYTFSRFFFSSHFFSEFIEANSFFCLRTIIAT